MNRTFIAALTPARARLLALMQRHTDFEVDEEIIAKGEEDRIASHQFEAVQMECPTERAAVQFIFDTRFRAGIPAPLRDRQRADRIIKAAVKIAALDINEDVICIDYAKTHSLGRSVTGYLAEFDFEKLLPERKKLLIMNLDNLDPNVTTELVGKMFPRILLVGAMAVQYAFAFGAQSATTNTMGSILYPAVEDAIKRTKWKKSERRSVLAMGVFPDLIEETIVAPKNPTKSFLVPKTLHY